ncbi:hypothetical protein [Actinomycetospora chibensis]|uniref:Methylase-associated X1 domain-containing protein n=1 Tax=Actinomycetospora chibensis TaxID=663606 RepID=A0ABV9RLV0_9PSEU|nr:hypothetical protein [Actinomycetospora chibensis]MDD7924297.1 hypothetical protein [Actinomycetospora chibensis]
MLAGRSYVEQVYPVQRRNHVYDLVLDAVERSGGRLLYHSRRDRAPLYVGVEASSNERLGFLVYPFTMTDTLVNKRPTNEVRGQIRLGSEKNFHPDTNHPVAFDVASVDVTVVLGVYVEGEIFLGLDPKLYDPLPMGISFYAKNYELAVAAEHSWHVWERKNSPGQVRTAPRSDTQLETLIAFDPSRLLDYVKLERYATDLGLDQSLRHAAARAAGEPVGSGLKEPELHMLEKKFDLDYREILEIISRRNRLEVAVKGGVAESHLEKQLAAYLGIERIESLDEDGQPDLRVTLPGGRTILVECKNASPNPYANGDFAVEVQKTRASKGDPSSRLYSPDQFDVVAACLFSATDSWSFRFHRTSDLPRSDQHPHKLRSMQRVDASWSTNLIDALGPLGVSS